MNRRTNTRTQEHAYVRMSARYAHKNMPMHAWTQTEGRSSTFSIFLNQKLILNMLLPLNPSIYKP